MKKTLLFYFLLLSFFFSDNIFGQSSFVINFGGSDNDLIAKVIKGKNNEFVAIREHSFLINGTTPFVQRSIYSFNIQSADDSIRWPVNFEREDTTIIPRAILFDNNFYIVAGSARRYNQNDSVIERFDFFAKYDINKNTVWEKFYNRPDPLKNLIDAFYHDKLMKLSTGDYLYACRLWYPDEPSKRILIRSFNSDGVVLQTRYFTPYLSGNINSLTYSIDSSAILLHLWGQFIPGCNNLYNAGVGALVLDTITFDTIGGVCYLQNFKIDEPYDAQLDNYGHLILAGVSDFYNFNTQKYEYYLGVYKLDTSYENTSFQPLEFNYFTDKDTTYQTLLYDCLDINADGEIYVAGIVNHPLGPWVPIYNHIYVVKLDQNLNLINEHYYGGDANYRGLSMTLLDDGGIAISGSKYNYMINDYEEDGFIIKTDPNLWVNTPRYNSIPAHSALVYPNPGNKNLYVRTTEKGSVFILYNLSGKQIRKKEIKKHITELDCSSVAKGVYVWKLFKKNCEIDRGKWIKIK